MAGRGRGRGFPSKNPLIGVEYAKALAQPEEPKKYPEHAGIVMPPPPSALELEIVSVSRTVNGLFHKSPYLIRRKLRSKEFNFLIDTYHSRKVSTQSGSITKILNADPKSFPRELLRPSKAKKGGFVAEDDIGILDMFEDAEEEENDVRGGGEGSDGEDEDEEGFRPDSPEDDGADDYVREWDNEEDEDVVLDGVDGDDEPVI